MGGVDAIVAQGIEAGGHRASFLAQVTPPQIPTMVVVSEIANRVKIPVIAAGGLADGSSLVAARLVGAQGFQLGSLFLRTTESKASVAYQQAVTNSQAADTVLTKAITGRWARGRYVCPSPQPETGQSAVAVSKSWCNKDKVPIIIGPTF